jgi:hypothetical protein
MSLYRQNPGTSPMTRCALAGVVLFLVVGLSRADDTAAIQAIEALQRSVENQSGGFWRLVAGPIAGGVVGFFASVGAARLQERNARKNRPMLKADVNPARGSVVRSPYGNPVIKEEYGVYVRMIVSNTGRQLAKSCRAVLTKVSRLELGEWKDTGYCDTVNLDWAYDRHPNQPSLSNELASGVDYFVDLCFQLHNDKLKLCITPLHVRYDDLIADDGSYQFTVIVSADGADPIRAVVDVAWHKSTRKVDVKLVSQEPVNQTSSKPWWKLWAR